MPRGGNIIVGSGAVGCELNGNAGAFGRTGSASRAVGNDLERCKCSGGDRGNSGDSWWTGVKTTGTGFGSRPSSPGQGDLFQR